MQTCIRPQAFTLIWSSGLLTVSMSVFILGGSNKRVTDSIKTKKAMTIRNRPLMNPESISTRPYLQSKTKDPKHLYNIHKKPSHKTFHMFSIGFTRKRRSWWPSSGSWGQRTGPGPERSSRKACGSRRRSIQGCWSRRRRRAPRRWKPEIHKGRKLKEKLQITSKGAVKTHFCTLLSSLGYESINLPAWSKHFKINKCHPHSYEKYDVHTLPADSQVVSFGCTVHTRLRHRK